MTALRALAEGSMKKLIARSESGERRNFLKTALAGAVIGAGLLRERGSAVAASSENPLPELPEGDSPLLRMQRDVQRAMKKPVAERKWAMAIDVRKCCGCNACGVACVAENALPPGVTYRRVPEVEFGNYPAVSRYFMPSQCMQCDKPPCMKAANSAAPGSVSKRPDGIVAIDYKKFRGRKAFDAAAKACPYGALYYDDGRFYTDGTPAMQPYEKMESFDSGVPLKRVKGQKSAPAGSGRKCHFCLHRLENGMLPQCVTTCIGRGAYFGDLNDRDSLINEVLAKNKGKVVRMREQRGTEPRVYYLWDDPAFVAAYHP